MDPNSETPPAEEDPRQLIQEIKPMAKHAILFHDLNESKSQESSNIAADLLLCPPKLLPVKSATLIRLEQMDAKLKQGFVKKETA